MKKNYSKLKDKRKYYFLLNLFLIALMGSQTSWGQNIQKQVIGSFPIMDGGFEGQTVGALGVSGSDLAVVDYWTQSSAGTANISNSGGTARSGNKCIVYTTGTAAKYYQSPKLVDATAYPTNNNFALSTAYIIQFYYKSAANVDVRGTLTSTSKSPALVSFDGGYVANTWLKATVSRTSSAGPLLANTWAGFRDGSATAASGIVDDFVVYPGSVIDVTAPDPVTAPVVAVNGPALDVSWTAPGTGVDGGGYMVVRYTVSPNPDNDPNVNGIYAIGNTITNGTGGLTGTVVYIGTATSFQDATVVSNTNYYYKIYTVDKAFNYSPNEVGGTGVITTSNNAPVANNDAFSVKQGGIATVLTGGATSVLTNDTDAESNPLTATVVTNPVNGTLTMNSDGTFSYLHNNSATTTDSFTYKANDGTSNSNVATVNITVTPPVATTNTWTGGTSTNFLTASNWTASDAPNPVLFGTLSSFTVPTGTTNSPVLNANYSTVSGAANCAVLTVNTGAILTTNANLTTNTATSSVSGTLNISAGMLNLPKFYIGNAASTAGVVNVATGATLTGNNVWRIGANATGTGTLNINGGTVTLTGTGTSANITVGNSTTGVVNINSGTLNVNYTYTSNTFATSFIITSNGIINIDAGSIVLPGNQISDISAFIDNSTNTGKIRVSGAALTAGKILSTTYDSGTDKTTVIAVNSPTTTWNGTWSNGTPTASVEAIIEGVYTTGTNGAFTAKKLTVNSGSLTINSNTNVTVQNEVINNAGANGIVVENNANLIQVLGTTNTNTGNIVVNRNSNALSRLDYTMWSSPVTGTQTLAQFSPLTSQSPSRFYIYNSGTNAYNSIDATLTNFAAGTGYLIRMPNTALTFPATETFAGQFTGVPNNGNVGFTGLTAGLYYAIGNPYPSTLSADLFLSGNATDGTLYFWRKTNAAVGTAYATYTALGGAGTSPGIGGITPNGILQVGQGFIVKPTGATLNFTNAMRTANNSNQILRTKAIEKDRVWLNLTNTTGVFSQALVGYMDGATQDVDAGIDGAYINDSAVALTSAINGGEYTIQGRALPFDPSDVVPLNFKTDVAGDYTIAIDHADGLFATGQDVYLVDSTTGAETNLKTDAYTFTATTGTANSRFSLKYQKTLKVDAPTFSENSVTVYKNNGTLYVNSGASAISNIKVFDVQGRLIAEQKNVNANTTSIKNLKANQQVLIVKVTAADNQVVNKKVVN